MPYKDKQKAKEYNAKYKKKKRSEDPQKHLDIQRKWQAKNRDKTRKYGKTYFNKNKMEVIKKAIVKNKMEVIKKAIVKNKTRYQKLRIKTIEHYGGKCACCGELNMEFLAIDHIYGGGGAHRKELKAKHLNILECIRKEKYPENKYRILCHNCNLSIGFYGYCPHQTINKND
jgi:hypothetical protein